jgi:hypothetical protein
MLRDAMRRERLAFRDLCAGQARARLPKEDAARKRRIDAVLRKLGSDPHLPAIRGSEGDDAWCTPNFGVTSFTSKKFMTMDGWSAKFTF